MLKFFPPNRFLDQSPENLNIIEDLSTDSPFNYENSDYTKYLNLNENSTQEKTQMKKNEIRSKRIQKREKAKNRKAANNKISEKSDLSFEKMYAKEDENIEEFVLKNQKNLPVDAKAQKKMIQMIRNRISAQNSRDRKKAYIYQLEKENKTLKTQNAELLDIIKSLENDKSDFKEQIKELQQQNINIKKNAYYDDNFIDEEENIQNNSYRNNSVNIIKGSSSKELIKFGFAFLTILSIFCFMGFKQNSNNENSILNSINQNNNNTKNANLMNKNNFHDAKDLEKYMRNIEYKI